MHDDVGCTIDIVILCVCLLIVDADKKSGNRCVDEVDADIDQSNTF